MDIEDTTLLSVGAHNKVTVFIGSHLDGRRSAGAHARRAGKGTSTSTTSAGINNSTEEARQRRHDRQWSCPGKRRRETQTDNGRNRRIARFLLLITINYHYLARINTTNYYYHYDYG